jgi:hypothetical protein
MAGTRLVTIMATSSATTAAVPIASADGMVKTTLNATNDCHDENRARSERHRASPQRKRGQPGGSLIIPRASGNQWLGEVEASDEAAIEKAAAAHKVPATKLMSIRR